MNKQLKKYIVPICIASGVLIAFFIIFMTIKPIIAEYNEAKEQQQNALIEEQRLKEEDERITQERQKEEMRLKSLKQIYQTTVDSSEENLGMFGNMFEEIIKRVQYNGLYIRSIEYDLKPVYDQVYNEFADEYNVCELKFFLVGEYRQLQSFLVELNNTFPYLITVSKLDIEAFPDNTNYIIINMSLTLYSKKLNPTKSNNKNKDKDKDKNKEKN